MRRLAIVLGMTLFFVAWVNFTVFWIVALILGGDAINGKVEDGRYYLGSHGRYTQVSADVYVYSRIHTISIFITHPLGIFGGGGLVAYAARKTKNA
jgi:hypothetical protein